MYTVLSGIGRLNVVGSKWLKEDFAFKRIIDVITNYEQVYFEVSSDDWPDSPRVVTLGTLRHRVTNFSHTVQQVFDSLGNVTIASIKGKAVVEEHFVKCADAVQANYSMKRVLTTQHPNTEVTPYEGDTLVLSKRNVTPQEYHKYCLTTVAGLIHLDDADTSTIYVLDAQKTSMQSRRNDVGILNFKDIGALTKRRITKEMISRATEQQPMYNQIYITLPTVPAGQTAMLVMGGYLHVMDKNTFFRVGDNTYCINTQACQMLDRFLESKKILNFDGVFEYETNGANGAQFIKEQLFSDENLVRYLTMTQSFIVFVDSDSIRVEREKINTGVSYGQYVVGKRPRSPIVLGFGLLPSYWVRPDDIRWSLTVGNNVRNNLLIHTTEEAEVLNPADNRIPYDKEEISMAHLLHISSEAVVIVQTR